MSLAVPLGLPYCIVAFSILVNTNLVIHVVVVVIDTSRRNRNLLFGKCSCFGMNGSQSSLSFRAIDRSGTQYR